MSEGSNKENYGSFGGGSEFCPLENSRSRNAGYQTVIGARLSRTSSHSRPANGVTEKGDAGNKSAYGLSNSEPQLSSSKKKKKKGLIANIYGTRYDCVKESLENVGFSTTRDERDDGACFLYWSDLAVTSEKIAEMKPYQRINHFPGMGEVCRKDCLAKNMAKMQKMFPLEYDYTPRTWVMPQDAHVFLSQVRDPNKKKRKAKTFIAKPSNGAMGNGIRLFKNPDKAPFDENYIVQEYLDKPMLIEGFKFDMRVYVLVTSCDPLKVFLFRDGLVRMSTKAYTAPNEHNIEELFMHLTNYSVNKFSSNFEKDEDDFKGSKRSFEFLNEWLKNRNLDVQKVWRDIADVIVKTLLVAEPHIIHQYRMCRPGVSPLADSTCFEILGFDIFLDRKAKPWLLEINRAPSFGTNEKIDQNVKGPLLEQSFKLLRIRVSDKKRCLANQKLESQKRLFSDQKRVSLTNNLWDKSKASRLRRKEQLQIQLQALRKESARQEFESRNLGKFRRIFPVDDRLVLERYITFLSKAFEVLLSGRATQLQKEVISTFRNPFRESDLVDMIEQCEYDDSTNSSVMRRPAGPKPLSCMPSSSPHLRQREEEEASSDESEDISSIGIPEQKPKSPKLSSRKGSPRKNVTSGSNSRFQRADRPSLASRSSTRSLSSLRFENLRNLPPSKRKKDDDDTLGLYDALAELSIKFPGKSDAEASTILNSILDNWRYHKPRVASYWLVKLDSIKRQKVIDIVRNNVKSVIQRFYETEDIESMSVTRHLNKIFNRMLWSHGQGLWACLNHTSGGPAPWETVFRTLSPGDMLSNAEHGCCKIAVELCKDCLLVVYQFANQSKAEIAGASQSGATGSAPAHTASSLYPS